MDHYLQYMLPKELKSLNAEKAQEAAKGQIAEVFQEIINQANIDDPKKQLGYMDWQDPSRAET